MEDIEEIRQFLIELLEIYVPPLQVRKNSPQVFEVAGCIPTMQGKQKVEGFYFGSVVPKPKDTRLYFFPIYTHPEEFVFISPELRKCLKGKSCFHFKKLNEEMKTEIKQMIRKAIDVYQKHELI
ncbi:hypothetical protein JYB64_12725 [Algoriphagus aestuarii]|nr:hypothetical protein [Algoriphagus aestuarii]